MKKESDNVSKNIDKKSGKKVDKKTGKQPIKLDVLNHTKFTVDLYLTRQQCKDIEDYDYPSDDENEKCFVPDVETEVDVTDIVENLTGSQLLSILSEDVGPWKVLDEIDDKELIRYLCSDKTQLFDVIGKEELKETISNKIDDLFSY